MIRINFAVFFNAIATVLFSLNVTAQQKNFTQTENGLIVYPDVRFSAIIQSVQISVISDKVIRVTASPHKEILPDNSLIIIQKPTQVQWHLKENKESVELVTASIKTTVNLSSGVVSFFDRNDKLLLAEKKLDGRNIQHVIHEGKMLHSLKQVFETTDEDAYYGLGQHQDDSWNYNGKQVVFFQNNTEVAIPFLVSVKNYGILWDNYSYSKAGDVRPYQQLSSLQLFDKNGNAGWLSASYSNDRNKPGELLLKRQNLKYGIRL